MELEFYELYPDFIANPTVLISGGESEKLGQNIYLFGEDDFRTLVYEIRYEYHCSPFKQAQFIGDILAVGHEEHFYLFDTKSERNILRLKMDGYFGSFKVEGAYIYVADSASIFCLDISGEIKWHTTELGVDGVIIHDIEEGKIIGSGEWDPPGGWRDFVVDKETGELL